MNDTSQPCGSANSAHDILPPVSSASSSPPVAGRWLRRAARATLFVGLVAWWLTLGPVTLGGPATFAVVDGMSMEPTLQGGDLVVARVQPSYGLGDLIVFPVADGRVVIHRIVAGSTDAGWTTQGDNNELPDSWLLNDDDVLGRYWFELADVGTLLLWTRTHPLLFGTVAAVIVTIVGLLGRVRSRRHRELVNAIARGRRAPRLAGRPGAELVALGAAGLATACMTVTLAVLGVADLLRTWSTLFASVVLMAAASTFAFLTKRLADGWRLPEPLASQYALSARCWEVPNLPKVEHTVEHSSSLDLRVMTDRRGLPVLRHTDALGTITYLTIRRDGVGHRWTVPTPTDSQQHTLTR